MHFPKRARFQRHGSYYAHLREINRSRPPLEAWESPRQDAGANQPRKEASHTQVHRGAAEVIEPGTPPSPLASASRTVRRLALESGTVDARHAVRLLLANNAWSCSPPFGEADGAAVALAFPCMLAALFPTNRANLSRGSGALRRGFKLSE
ncbi:hypothetical protein MTO96_007558 [Rhipicephalus appendiculatus]